MKSIRDIRGREPRLKPGITWFRLFTFVVVVLALAVLAEHFATGKSPPTSDCYAKGISSELHLEGSCTEGDTKLVVVNKHSVLKLASLEARVEGIRERRTLSGPAGSATAKGDFLSFTLAVTNRTDEPVRFAEGQSVLLTGSAYGEDIEVEKDYERRSFLSLDREIPPGATENGTVAFAVPSKQTKVLREEGNLDLENFGTDNLSSEPEAIFGESEYGVIRTYQ